MSETGASLAAPVVQRTSGGLGFKVLFAASIGVIVAQLGMVTLMQGVGLGGWGFIGAMFIAFVLALTNAMAYAEMSLMMPGARSLSSYAEAAVGNFPAILLVFAGYVTPAIFGLPVELILADQILRDALSLPLPPLFWPVALVVVFAGLNILGADVFAKVQTTLSFTVLAFLLVVGLMAVSGHAAAPVAGAGWSQMGQNTVTVSLVALAFWVFVGSEFVTPLVPEAANAKRDLPRAMIGSLVAIFLVQLLFAAGAGAVIPSETLATSPVPHLDYALAVLGPVGQGGLRGPRAGGVRQPAELRAGRRARGCCRAWPRTARCPPSSSGCTRACGTPVRGDLVRRLPAVAGPGLVGRRSGAIVPLTISASVAWILAYVVAQISLMVLRRRHPRRAAPVSRAAVPAAAAAGGRRHAVRRQPEFARAGTDRADRPLHRHRARRCSPSWARSGSSCVMKRGLFEPVAPARLTQRS